MSDLMTTPARAERQRARRRSRRTRRLALWMLAALLAGGGTYLATQQVGGTDDDAAAGKGVRLRTTLVAMRLADDPSGQADSLMVSAVRADDAQPIRLFIPAATLAPIPGQGFEPLARALGAGDGRLLELSVENLLGMRIDRAVIIDDVSLGRLIDAVGGVQVTVPETITEVEDGVSQQVATEGSHRMGGAQAVTYLTYRGGTETELTRFVRAQAVLDALSAHTRAALNRAARTVEPAGATTAEDLQAFAASLGSKGTGANLVLPVEPAGGSDTGELYRLDGDRSDTLLRREMPGALFTLKTRIRVDVRNGNGTPEIGERVAARLVPEGFVVEVSGNAPSFDEKTTRIVIYEDTAEARAIAERVRRILKVGRIELATRPQSVVDLTIVIGRDFRGGA